MNRQPYVAGAAIVAGLIVGGGAYTARHGIGQPPVDSAAASRSSVAGQIPRVPHVRLAEWHPPKIPKVTASGPSRRWSHRRRRRWRSRLVAGPRDPHQPRCLRR